jgi:hypothetical protein
LSLVDRFGGVFWFVLALFLPWLLGITLLDGLPPIRWHVMIFGIACPGIAVLIPAIPVKRANTKYVLLALVILSLVTPFLGLAEMRAGITMSGSTGIGAWANGLSEVLRTLPFLVAGLYAIGTTMLPTTPVSLYAWTRLALLACSAFFVLTVAKNITGFYGMAAVGSGGIRLPWLARWLIEIAIPSGFERPTWL